MKAALVVLIVSILCGGALPVNAMPVHPDVLAMIRRTPPDEQAKHLDVPDGVNQPPVRTFRDPITHASAVVLLVDFSDNEADPSHPPSAYDELIFSTGTYPTGSMQDYYSEVSYSQFTVDGVVPGQWFRMPQTYAYYVDGQRGFGAYPHNAQKLVEDAIAAADPIVNFSQYDSDGDGMVDALFVVHAGPGYEETGNTDMIHSHMWDLSASPNGRYQADGVEIGLYSVEPEEHGNGELISIGVFCHEFGHVLGLPDLYDYDYDAAGVGTWCIMAGGSWGGDSHSPETPVHFSAWCKKQFEWITETILTTDTQDVPVPAVEQTGLIYRMIPSGNEYFLVENRQKTGFDINLPNSGLLIWHVDDAMPNNDSQCIEVPCEAHYLVALEQADGQFDLENNVNRGDDGDTYPGSTGNRVFDTESQPNSWDYDARPTWVSMNDISDSGIDMTFDVTFSPSRPFMIYRSHAVVSDDDGDGVPEAGETVDFTVTISNFGLDVSAVSAVLTGEGPVTVTGGTADYGDFAYGEEKTNSDNPFRIRVDDNASRGARVEFTLMLGGSGSFIQELTFTMAVSPLPIETTPGWTGQANYSSVGKAADIDGNGYPDLVVGNFMDRSAIYWNTDGKLPGTPGWHTSGSPTAFDIVPVDLETDTYMELVFLNVSFDPYSFQYLPDRSTLYPNTTGIPETSPVWQSQLHTSGSGDVGDIDGDGIPDLVIGCIMEANVAYKGLATGTFEVTPFWISLDVRDTSGAELADMDADGDLDLVAAQMDDYLVVYFNDGGSLEQNPSWQSTSRPLALSMDVADMDANGYPDVALGTYGTPNLVFINDSGILPDAPSWQSEDVAYTYRVVWGDVDNDGYLELAAANLYMTTSLPEGRPNVIYYNDSGTLTTYAAWTSDTEGATFGMGFADFDGDGDCDLFAANLGAAPEMFDNKLPAGPPCDTLGVELVMPSDYFAPGDTCSCDLNICNPDTVTYEDIPVFVILDVYGSLFFAPSFGDFDYYPQDVSPGIGTIAVLPAFAWPEGAGSATGIVWYAAMTDPGITQLFGEMDTFAFGWGAAR